MPCKTTLRDACLGAAALVVVAAGCAPVGPLVPAGNYVRTFDHDITQAALLPAPAGPHATGPLNARHRFSLEASAQVSTVVTSGHTRGEGMSGDVVPVALVRGRAAFGVSDRVELGLAVEYASAGWGSPRAADAPRDALTGDMRRGGALLRALVAGSTRLGLGVNGELWIGVTQTLRTGTTTDTCGPYDRTQPSECATPRTSVYPFSAVEGHHPIGAGAFGLFGTGTPATGVTLQGGALVQVQSAAVGHLREGASCVVYPGQSGLGACGIHAVPSPDASFGMVLALTPWLSAAYTAGPVTLTAQVHANITDALEVMLASPVGADLSARFTF